MFYVGDTKTNVPYSSQLEVFVSVAMLEIEKVMHHERCITHIGIRFGYLCFLSSLTVIICACMNFGPTIANGCGIFVVTYCSFSRLVGFFTVLKINILIFGQGSL